MTPEPRTRNQTCGTARPFISCEQSGLSSLVVVYCVYHRDTQAKEAGLQEEQGSQDGMCWEPEDAFDGVAEGHTGVDVESASQSSGKRRRGSDLKPPAGLHSMSRRSGGSRSSGSHGRQDAAATPIPLKSASSPPPTPSAGSPHHTLRAAYAPHAGAILEFAVLLEVIRFRNVFG